MPDFFVAILITQMDFHQCDVIAVSAQCTFHDTIDLGGMRLVNLDVAAAAYFDLHGVLLIVFFEYSIQINAGQFCLPKHTPNRHNLNLAALWHDQHHNHFLGADRLSLHRTHRAMLASTRIGMS